MKSPTFNTLTPPTCATSVGKYVFRSQRTRFSVERIHLPPAEVGADADMNKKKGRATASLDF